jgi:hypothetical protein
MTRSSARIAFWISTLIVALGMIATGVMNLLGAPEVMQTIRRLGYPEYFPALLGAAKLSGALALLTPRWEAAREWAYAGFAFLLVAATASHLAAGDPLAEALTPALVLAPLAASYALRRAAGAAYGAPRPAGAAR